MALISTINILICGGGLQGVELCFLAKQAHWNIILIDKNSLCPAKNLANTFYTYDLCQLAHNTNKNIAQVFQEAHLIIPATENPKTLDILEDYCRKNALPFAFDVAAYAISSSKLKSRDFFIQCKSPIPTPFLHEKDITYPLLAKPSNGSGSQGVQVFHSHTEFLHVFPQGIYTEHWIFEAFYEGPSYSIEICGKNGNYKAFAVTKLHMDEFYDCSAVTTPSTLSQSLEQNLAKEGIKLAKALNLQGLMDLEVIVPAVAIDTTQNILPPYVILEIDARFPSQTPTAVFYATGVNLIEELACAFIDYTIQYKKHDLRAIRYEHILYKDTNMKNLGEHIMTTHGPLEMKDFFGLPALTARGNISMVTTFILKENSTYPEQIPKLQQKFFEQVE